MKRLRILGLTATLSASLLAPVGAAEVDPRSDNDAPSTWTESEIRSVADGVADATATIQRAIDSGFGAITLPKGIYRISQPLVVDLDKVGYTSLAGGGVARIEMTGPGPAIKFVGTHYKSADPSGFSSDVWDRQRMPLVDGIAIIGRHDEAEGIAAVGTMALTITRTHIRQVLHGIHLEENNRNVIIADSHIYENRGVGIYYDNVNLHQSSITNCHISYNAMGGVVSRAGNVRNLHIAGCDLESNQSPRADPTANVLIDCTDSDYGTGEVAITGCTIQHNSRSPGSANIRMIGLSQADGKQGPIREGHVTITGNVLSDVDVNVHLKSCRGVVLTGNTFWQGYEQNLLVEASSNIVVGPNNFDRNPRYSGAKVTTPKNGLVFRNASDCTLTGLHINRAQQAPAALVVEDCRRMHITGCTILDCDHGGLLLKNAASSRVSDCLIRDDRPETGSFSLKVIDGAGNQVVDNLLEPAA